MSMRTPLSRVRGLGSAKSGTEHFWRQRVTAVANVPLTIAGVVIVVSLLGRNHAAVAQILGSPLIAIMLLLFIILGHLSHAARPAGRDRGLHPWRTHEARRWSCSTRSLRLPSALPRLSPF